MIQKGKPEQLRMFMSAREIQAEYDPHEGDRYWHGTEFPVHMATGGAWVRENTERFGQRTGRTSRTDGGVNIMIPGGPPGKPYMRGPKRIKAEAETNEQMWDRKLAESQAKGMDTHIAREGVLTPVPLAQTRHPVTGRRMVGGGQHRIATMAHLNPDQLMPVLHVEHVQEAKARRL